MKKEKDNIYDRVLVFIKGNNLVSGGEKVLLAMSAGKDSMALLDFFQHLKKMLSVEIGIFHLNHMMRAKESDADEKFLLEIASENGIEIFIRKFDFNNIEQKQFSFEEYARIKRYEFMDKICSEKNYDIIATAHNRDDNIETILMRIFSGTGIHGLGGIDCRRENIIRPLLFLSSEQIYEHLRSSGIKWREDSSNKDNKYTRNYLRNSVIPAINKRFGNCDSVLSLSNISREYIELINELLKEKEGELYALDNSDVIIDKEKYIRNKKLFKFVLINILKDIYKEFVSEKILEEIYKNAVTERSNALLYLNKNIIIKKTVKNGKKVIVISKDLNYNYVNTDWEYKVDLNQRTIKNISINEIKKEIRFEIVDYPYYLSNKESGRFVFTGFNDSIKYIIIRNRREGDRIKLEYGKKKIKDLMIDNKLDRIQKGSVPLLLIDSQIAAYMPGVIFEHANNRVAAGFHVLESSKKVLAIHF